MSLTKQQRWKGKACAKEEEEWDKEEGEEEGEEEEAEARGQGGGRVEGAFWVDMVPCVKEGEAT